MRGREFVTFLSGGAVVRPGVSQVVLYGPVADLRSVELIAAQAQHLAGGKAVGGRRLAVQALVQQRLHLRWPIRPVIAARNAGLPERLLVMSAGGQVVRVELIKASS